MSDKADFCSVCGAPVGEENIVVNAAPQASGVAVCAECGNPITTGAKVCTVCGAPVEAPTLPLCAECGTPIPNGATACTSCGAPVAGVAAPMSENAMVPPPPPTASVIVGQNVSAPVVGDCVPPPPVQDKQETPACKESAPAKPQVDKGQTKPAAQNETIVPKASVQEKIETPAKKNNTPLIVVVSLLVVALLCGIFFLIPSSDDESDAAVGQNDNVAETQDVSADEDAVSESLVDVDEEPVFIDFSNRTFTVNGVSFKMVAVDGGTFQMGATPEQVNASNDERPVHSVTLSNYYIGEIEVTQALWIAVMGSNPSFFTGNVLRPVEKVSYNDCIEFIDKLNGVLANELPAGCRFRLPTEAEWEFAARGGNNSNGYQYSGGNYIDNIAWYEDCSGNISKVVKSKSPNELGIYDMSGNVYEWCNDWYSRDYYSTSPSNNPQGPSTGTHRVIRGGSWDLETKHCRVAFRNYASPGAQGYSNGLRLALDAGVGQNAVAAIDDNNNSYECVDLGLSVMWATCNVGANSPEAFGDYYAWGETTTKSNYYVSNYLYLSEGYICIDNNIAGTQYDVANVKWGGSWRMPTASECVELKRECTWNWITYNGVCGYTVIGPNGNSIFMPAAGYCEGSEVIGVGVKGNYWSDVFDEGGTDCNAAQLDFKNGDVGGNVCYYSPDLGCTVRPVCDR